MNTSLRQWLTGTMLAASCLLGVAHGAITNTVSWSDSFESYASGTSIAGTNGWVSQTAGGGVVTNDTARANLLTNYPVAGKSYPLPEPPTTHTNILQVTAVVANDVQSTPGGVVSLNFMTLPTWSDTAPVGQTNDQCAFYIGTNGLLAIWHQNRVHNPVTNEWLTLTNSPVIGTNNWARFTLVHDYSNNMFQIRVNEGLPLVDDKGWGYGGTNGVGSWFYMVQTNGALGALSAEAAQSYLEDVTAYKRSLVWSRSNFTESVTNNGGIDNSTPLTITLALDTFNGLPGDDFVSAGKVIVTNLPAGLSAVARLGSGTNVLSVTLTNRAAVHESADSIGNLGIRLADSAFALGRSWDVTGNQQTNLVISFTNTPALGYSALGFIENTTNNGSIDNTSPLLITLTNGAFAGLANDEFVGLGRIVVANLPAGLSAQVKRDTATQLSVRLVGTAAQHNTNNTVSTLQLQFQAGAFSIGGTPLSSVFNLSTNLSIVFTPPSLLSYLSTTFTETVTNNGSVNGTTLTLANKSFNAANGEDLVPGKVTVAHLPSGLQLHIVRTGAQSATLSFTGTADQHAASDSISNLGLTFLDSAFVGANAAGVANSSLGNLVISYANPRTVSYGSASFVELAVGVIDNRSPMVITLAGDTFTGSNGQDLSAYVSVGNLPQGLTAQFTRDTATNLSVRLGGAAVSNASSDNVSTVSFTFLDGAFAGGNSIYVGNYQNTGISVTFNDQAESYHFIPFEETFEQYVRGTRISGSNGWYADYSGEAGIVTNDATATARLLDYVRPVARSYPVSGTHTQVLYVQDYLHNNVHSESITNVFVDFLMMMSPVSELPSSNTNDQYACCLTTNNHLVVWHRNVTTATNEWITLSNAPSISTTAWVRLTFESDYTHKMYRVRVNEGSPIVDPRGWSGYGGASTGSWFYMAQTNGSMTTFKVTGEGAAFLEDFTVREALPDIFGKPPTGSVYIFR